MPLGERFTCQLSEDRPLVLVGGVSYQRFALGDAQSAHVEARVTDATIAMGEASLVDLAGGSLGPEVLESVRQTREAVAFYSSDATRPGTVDVRVPLELRREAVDPAVAVIALSVAATLTALLLPDDGQIAGALGVLALPVTLAAAILVVRERTPLAARLQRTWPRDALLPAMAVLWLVVLVRLVMTSGSWLW